MRIGYFYKPDARLVGVYKGITLQTWHTQSHFYLGDRNIIKG
jgi:hypothetical protein